MNGVDGLEELVESPDIVALLSGPLEHNVLFLVYRYREITVCSKPSSPTLRPPSNVVSSCLLV